MDRGLHPRLLGIAFDFVEPDNRLQAVRTIVPLVPEDRRGLLESCIRHQEELGRWELDPERCPWNYLRHPEAIEHADPATGEVTRIQMGKYGPGNAKVDDLTALEYGRFFDAVHAPEHLILDKFFAGIEDYLVNATWILEEWLLVGAAQKERTPPVAPVNQQGMVYRRVLSFADLRMELHLKNLVIRIRAGWDKILNNILAPWFDARHPKGWPNRWAGRINHLDQLIGATGAETPRYWADWKRNAEEYTSLGLRDMREGELHYWSKRVRENFGNSAGEITLDALQRLVVQEHFRLMDVWLLTIAMLRSVQPTGAA